MYYFFTFFQFTMLQEMQNMQIIVLIRGFLLLYSCPAIIIEVVVLIMQSNSMTTNINMMEQNGLIEKQIIYQQQINNFLQDENKINLMLIIIQHQIYGFMIYNFFGLLFDYQTIMILNLNYRSPFSFILLQNKLQLIEFLMKNNNQKKMKKNFKKLNLSKQQSNLKFDNNNKLLINNSQLFLQKDNQSINV
ncbi:unnamed protein product [Paramecium sonneborni]|uniref:Transmembrane protein n=1 Tax=Paramecium sonneborni TaxID=65129 RepID=A0A8S1NA18_9CILI|nr:unnamed protein product [Paramecium sonneborni]